MAVYIGSTAGYMKLDSWVLAKIIQLATKDFCKKYWIRDDPQGRQFDQTTQAARSISANIAEGSARHHTSLETEMKLLDVARASASELSDDLLTILLENDAEIWGNDHPAAKAIREIKLVPSNYGENLLKDVGTHIRAQKALFDEWLKNSDLMIRANALLVLVSREIRMLRNQIDARLKEFEERGGFTENMTETRLQAQRTKAEESEAPLCPDCGAPMLLRTARKGVNCGKQFWSCSNFHKTGCRGTRPKD